MSGSANAPFSVAAEVSNPAEPLHTRVELTPSLDVVGEVDLATWPLRLATRWKCLLFRPNPAVEGRHRVTFVGPGGPQLRNLVESRVGFACHWHQVGEAEFATLLDQVDRQSSLTTLLDLGPIDSAVIVDTTEQVSLDSLTQVSNEVVRIVNAALYDAMKLGGSDIHFQREMQSLLLLYRIDGVMSLAATLPGGEFADQVISRLKILAELDISEQRVPQDGRMKVAINERATDFRVSVMPSLHGEDAVLRVLDRQQLVGKSDSKLSLESCRFDADLTRQIRRLARLPYGLLLVSGPTGSGKTTTLYGAVSEIHDGTRKIITIEDPVEYQLRGVLQVPINERRGLTFSRGLRSVLRHDPDVIMVGEIRDSETASIAIQAALTGHLVLSTVHANSSLDVIGRMQNMGVDPGSFATALSGIVAQRLLRELCPECAMPDSHREEHVGLADAALADGQGLLLRRAVGCANCRYSGYRGRRAVAEIVSFDEEMRDLLIRGASASQLRSAIVARGFRSIRQKGLALVRSGSTTMSEVDRVTTAG